MGIISLLQVAKFYWDSLLEKYAGKRFYHISTDEVYGALTMPPPEGIGSPFKAVAFSEAKRFKVMIKTVEDAWKYRRT